MGGKSNKCILKIMDKKEDKKNVFKRAVYYMVGGLMALDFTAEEIDELLYEVAGEWSEERKQVEKEYERKITIEAFIGCANCGAKTKLVSDKHEENLCVNCR